MASDVTGTLARFAAELSYEAIPDRVREYCKTILLDSLACAFAGYQGEETPQLAGLAADLAHAQESSVIGGARLSLAGATMVNGYLITAVTMCDVYRTALTHVTPEVIPPALAIAERDGLVTVRVSDTGTGIPAHERKRVFERFYQIDSARTNVQGGTGLGLSIAKHIVEAQGGTIWVEGVDPQGACLCFTLRFY